MPSQAHTSAIPRTQPRKRPRSPRALQGPNAIAFTLESFQALGGPGKTKVYELGRAGVLDLFTDAIGRRLITGDSGRRYLQPRTA